MTVIMCMHPRCPHHRGPGGICQKPILMLNNGGDMHRGVAQPYPEAKALYTTVTNKSSTLTRRNQTWTKLKR